MNRLTEIKIALVASIVIGPVCGWLAPKAVEFFGDDEPTTGYKNGAITCPADAAMVEQLDPSVGGSPIGVTSQGTICEFR